MNFRLIKTTRFVTAAAVLFLCACKERARTAVKTTTPKKLEGQALNQVKPPIQKPKESAIRPPAISKALAAAWNDYKRPKKISQVTIDNQEFFVKRFVVGLKDFLSAKSPFLRYDKPENADYFEIMRCSTGAVITGALDNRSLFDLGSSQNLYPSERSAMMQANDYWKQALNHPKCAILRLNHVETYIDSWAPSGSYRCLIRACVALQESM